MRTPAMSGLHIVDATATYATWHLGGATFSTSRSLVNAAIAALDHDEITVHGAVGLLSRAELRRLLAEMAAAHEAWLDKQRERVADFDS